MSPSKHSWGLDVVIETCKSYDHESALRFPLLPHAHQTALRYIFDWAIAGQALDCIPGDLVLEFAAGTGYASEWFNRLGYCTVAVDLDAEILSYARERMTLDQRIERRRARFVAGDGQCLPFADSSFDGVICLNALHHMPDPSSALYEIRRILKPGGRAVFSEPGSRHADSPESKMVSKQFGAVENSIVLDQVYETALAVGFERMLLKPHVYPELVEVDYSRLDAYRRGQADTPFTRPDQIARYLQQSHSVFVLIVPGERVKTSSRPNLLRASIMLNELPVHMYHGQEIQIRGTIHNTGDSLWLSSEREFGGFVTFGVKLCLPSGRLLAENLGRTRLAQDVPPGGKTWVHSSFQLPEALTPGDYVLRFDMVDEQIAWFEQLGSPVPEHHFTLLDEPTNPMAEPALKRPQVPSTLPARYARLTRFVGAALATMGITAPSSRLLEPVARAIRSLGGQDSQGERR